MMEKAASFGSPPFSLPIGVIGGFHRVKLKMAGWSARPFPIS